MTDSPRANVALRHRRAAEVGLVEVAVDGERPGPERHLAASAGGLGRTVALPHRSSTLYHINYYNRHRFFSETAMPPNPRYDAAGETLY
jgi:hypothetical protein